MSPENERRSVLVVEDSRAVAGLLRERIEEETGEDAVVAGTYAEAAELLADGGHRFMLAVLDLNLPDARAGEIVPLVVGKGVPALVLTGGVNDDLRDRLLGLGVVDYVIKDQTDAIDQVLTAVLRIQRNQGVEVLVVDDSKSARGYLSVLLRRWGFRTVEASSGERALEVLAQRGDTIRLVLCDQNMPGMDGLTLIREIRRDRPREQLGIIGISNHGSGLLSAKQLKAGANDFLTRPFLEEEFFVRVNQNVELIELLRIAQENANTDHLTGLYNRRYLADAGNRLHEAALRGGLSLAVLLLDLDHFKKINDTYGHYAGDVVLRRVAARLRQSTREADLLARFGGEEFCLLATGTGDEGVAATAEKLRRVVEEMEITYRGIPLKLTASIGCTAGIGQSLEAMIHEADRALYRAKELGRNRVVVAEEALCRADG